jgi:hypothetical protein
MNNETKFIDVNGAQVADLTPNHERALALVDLKVLGRLTSLLQTTDLYSVKRKIKGLINDAKTLEEYVAVIDEELAFQTTVNLIQEVTARELPVIVGKIDLDNPVHP